MTIPHLRQIALAVALSASLLPIDSGFGGGMGAPRQGWGTGGFGPPGDSTAPPAAVTLQSQMGSTDEEWMVLWPKLQRIILLREEVGAAANSFAGNPFGMGGPGGFGMGGSGLEAPNNLGMGASGIGMANQADPFNPQKVPGLPKPPAGFFGALAGTAGFSMPAPDARMFTVAQGNAVLAQLTELATMLRDQTTTDSQIKEKLALIRATRQKAKTDLQAAEQEFMQWITPVQAGFLVASGYLD